MAMTIVAAYDISHDQRRAKVAALLQVWGDRIQYSLFLLSIPDEDLTELVGKVEALINPKEDSFHVFRQCATCWESHDVRGQADTPTKELCWTVM